MAQTSQRAWVNTHAILKPDAATKPRGATMAIRSNDARRASTKNQSDPADPTAAVFLIIQKLPHRTVNETLLDQPICPALVQHSGISAANRRHRGRRHVRRWLSCALSAGALGLFLSGVPGCTTTSGLASSLGDGHCIDDFLVGYRNRALAEKLGIARNISFATSRTPVNSKPDLSMASWKWRRAGTDVFQPSLRNNTGDGGTNRLLAKVL